MAYFHHLVEFSRSDASNAKRFTKILVIYQHGKPILSPSKAIWNQKLTSFSYQVFPYLKHSLSTMSPINIHCIKFLVTVQLSKKRPMEFLINKVRVLILLSKLRLKKEVFWEDSKKFLTRVACVLENKSYGVMFTLSVFEAQP